MMNSWKIFLATAVVIITPTRLLIASDQVTVVSKLPRGSLHERRRAAATRVVHA